MADRIPHDHPTVESVRATLDRVGRMDQPKLVLPNDPELFPETIVHFVLDGQQYHARINRKYHDTPEIRSVRDNARLARAGEGEGEDTSVNRLHEWFETNDLEFGRSVHVDVVEPNHLYGVRLPGERAVYTDIPKPNSSLSDIANNLE
ncbi:DUF7112 family protein [Halocatena marina]|uniref:Uncharacterized protein n=1 Tax=Halocatena marina TaxID=2934937 RepID=A0ABD5YQY3_9EURY|nr:hypothetical protein [Halocatena marina]